MNLENLQCRKAPKLLFISAALMSSSIFSSAQTTIAIAPSKMNVLYIGVDNPVSVAASNGSDDKVTVSVSGGKGTISKVGSGLYNVRVADVTDNFLMTVFVDGKLAGTSGFRVRSLPVPVATIGGYNSGANVTAAAFRTQAGLGLYVKDFPFDVRYEVAGFTLSVDAEKGSMQSVECQSALFSSEAKQLIEQNVKPGRTVTIDSIRAKDPSGKELKLSSLVYYIK